MRRLIQQALGWIPLLNEYLSLKHAVPIAAGGPVLKGSGPLASDKEAFIDGLLANMTVADMVLQLHLMFGDNLVGSKGDNGLYDFAMRFSPNSPVGIIHDWYPLNTTHYNTLQQLNLQKAHLSIPFLHVGECLHGVGSFAQSLFPQSIGLAASWDSDLVGRVGRAIGREARSIGIHACFAPVLDLGTDPRWGRLQEAWGEDRVLTAQMGVAYAAGLSKNSSWADPEAVVPVMKHFAAHGSPQAGRNAAPFTGRGRRQVLQEMMVPFKAAVDLGGVRGVMMAYHELDEVPAVVDPFLYKTLEDWGFDGFTIADDTAVRQLQTVHKVAGSAADAIGQWFNAGGMIQFYDYPLDVYINATKDLVANGTVPLTTLRSHVRRILRVKWDLGLFNDSMIPSDVDPPSIVREHVPLTLEAAHKSIVLLKNTNKVLPLQQPGRQNISAVALIGPFADILNYGDYSGPWGQYPATHASTLRQGILEHLRRDHPGAELRTLWGSSSWEYNTQNVVPPYLLSANGSAGGLAATYYAATNFTDPRALRIEVPALDWGLYPPPGLPSTNFSATWEGTLRSPADSGPTAAWIGVGVSPGATARLFLDGDEVTAEPPPPSSRRGSILGNIMPLAFVHANGTAPPPGAAPFVFHPGREYAVRIEFVARATHTQLRENVASVRAQCIFFWNLGTSLWTYDPTSASEPEPAALAREVEAAVRDADVVILALGAAWNSDGENADRAMLSLAPSQARLAHSVFAGAGAAGMPVVLVLQGGRPFAIPEEYAFADAVLSGFFPGQSGGQAIADVLFGAVNPGGRMPISVPRRVGRLPAPYNYKPSAKGAGYVDDDADEVFYPFGYGLSYTSFSVSEFRATVAGRGAAAVAGFGRGDILVFSARVKNDGPVDGSYVLQVYLLGRLSAITQPVRQLVAFRRVELEAGAEFVAEMELEVDRYLPVLNRTYQWELEKGQYTFALLDHGGDGADARGKLTVQCV